MSNYPVAAIMAGATAACLAATLLASWIGRTKFPLPSADTRIGCIDGLRGYLALSVLIHHFVVWMQATSLGGAWAVPSVNLFAQLGAGGVALFFMVTGLVFYPRILAGFRATAWPAVYTMRVFRIVPLVAVSVAIITLLIAARTGRGLDAQFPAAAAQWITTWGEPPLLGFADSGRINAYVLWSLRYEWLFYLAVLPACALAMDLVRGRLPSWTVPVALLAIGLLGREAGLPTALLRFLPLFAIGMLAYEVRSREAIARHLRTRPAAAVAVLALALGMVTARTPYGSALPLFALFFVCVACGNALFGVLRTRGALVLGECSFGIYLLHGVVLSVAFVDAGAERLAPEIVPALLPLAAVAVTMVTPLTFLIVERPALRLGALLARRMSAGAAARLRLDAAPSA
ncbi:acyltransferase family protein [Methylobacterium nodulans]|uniref:Acyltransferase 3 n=1 Tax=Methylobacterium nodulans (strain LMG 21967 / CNCM I-2342 / ORS 2060) TaxID=460265 RepID=B8INC8_METNO|nr:acyltransferase [Methylobacterium nodulans]ACL56454.1 acyltransferase 3 [Methylobacterium nodulans ORS 2060]